jgi:hypothetical protein
LDAIDLENRAVDQHRAFDEALSRDLSPRLIKHVVGTRIHAQNKHQSDQPRIRSSAQLAANPSRSVTARNASSSTMATK